MNKSEDKIADVGQPFKEKIDCIFLILYVVVCLREMEKTEREQHEKNQELEMKKMKEEELKKKSKKPVKKDPKEGTKRKTQDGKQSVRVV